MACNVCKKKLGVCQNEFCLDGIEGDFYCFKSIHFCSRRCWKAWLVDENKSRLEKAKDVCPDSNGVVEEGLSGLPNPDDYPPNY